VGRFLLLEEPKMEPKQKQQIAEHLLNDNDLKIRQLGAIGLLPFDPKEIATLNLAIQSLTTQSQDPVVTRGALAGLLPIAKRLTDSEQIADVLRGLALLDDRSRALAVKLVGDLSLTADHIDVLVSTFQGITEISSSASNSEFRAAKLLLVNKIEKIDKKSLSRVREIEEKRLNGDRDHEILRALGKP
jgi:hypothetical protein